MGEGSLQLDVTVIIPTINEERNLEKCIKSVRWAQKVCVYDSYSTDRTLEIAEDYEIEIFQRHFDNFSDHKNWAIENVPVTTQWILILDADEEVSEELREEFADVISSGMNDGYYVPRKNIFMERWIRWGGWYPDYQLRLFRKGRARYEKRIVHEHMIVDGRIGYLKNPLIHQDLKGIERYIDRHNVYSSMEAVEATKILKKISLKGKILQEPTQYWQNKRRKLKTFSYKYMPFRPVAKFLWIYLFKLGFLDGKAGFIFSILHAIYEFNILLKMKELKNPNSPISKKYHSSLGGE